MTTTAWRPPNERQAPSLRSECSKREPTVAVVSHLPHTQPSHAGMQDHLHDVYNSVSEKHINLFVCPTGMKGFLLPPGRWACTRSISRCFYQTLLPLIAPTRLVLSAVPPHSPLHPSPPQMAVSQPALNLFCSSNSEEGFVT